MCPNQAAYHVALSTSHSFVFPPATLRRLSFLSWLPVVMVALHPCSELSGWQTFFHFCLMKLVLAEPFNETVSSLSPHSAEILWHAAPPASSSSSFSCPHCFVSDHRIQNTHTHATPPPPKELQQCSLQQRCKLS